MSPNASQTYVENLKMQVNFGELCCDIEIDDGFVTGHSNILDSEKHAHSSYELQMITQGEGILYIQQADIPLHSGDCILIGRDAYHSIFNLSQDFRRHDFRFRFYVQKGKGKYDSLENSEAQNIMTIFSDFSNTANYRFIRNSSELIRYFELIIDELQKRSSFTYIKLKNLFSALLIALFRDISLYSFKQNPLPSKVKDEKRCLIIEKFFDNYSSKLSAKDLAQQLSVSERQLSRIMKKLYHTTFKQKLLDVRVEVAKDLLKKNMKIDEIAEAVGYTSSKNFNTIFIKKTGLSPYDFRNSLL